MPHGETMRKWREKRGLNQYELAELSGVTQKTIWALENNKNNGSVTTVELLADALGLSIDKYVGHKRVVRNGGGMNDADNKAVSHPRGKGIR